MSKSFNHSKDKDRDRDEEDNKLVIVTDNTEDPAPDQVRGKDTEEDAMSSESSPLDVVGVSSPSPAPSPASSPVRHVTFAVDNVVQRDAAPVKPAALADREEEKMTSVKEDEPMDQEDSAASDDK